MEDGGSAAAHLVGSGDDDGPRCLAAAGLFAHVLEGQISHLYGFLFGTDGKDQHVPGHTAVAFELVERQGGDGHLAKAGQCSRTIAGERPDDQRSPPAQHALIGGGELFGRFVGFVDVDGIAGGQPPEGGLDAGLQGLRGPSEGLAGLG